MGSALRETRTDVTPAMRSVQAKFSVGQLVHHRLFDYRGVVVDIDPQFQGTEDWYRQVARSRPPKDAPWYHVLVHEATHQTYVAERNLEPDAVSEPIDHPLVPQYFEVFRDGTYLPRQRSN
jgi:heat shock protein HspQ